MFYLWNVKFAILETRSLSAHSLFQTINIVYCYTTIYDALQVMQNVINVIFQFNMWKCKHEKLEYPLKNSSNE